MLAYRKYFGGEMHFQFEIFNKKREIYNKNEIFNSFKTLLHTVKSKVKKTR